MPVTKQTRPNPRKTCQLEMRFQSAGSQPGRSRGVRAVEPEVEFHADTEVLLAKQGVPAQARKPLVMASEGLIGSGTGAKSG